MVASVIAVLASSRDTSRTNCSYSSFDSIILRRTRIDGSLFLSLEMVGSFSSCTTSDLTIERASLARGSLSTVTRSSSSRASLWPKSKVVAGSSPLRTRFNWAAASLALWAKSAFSEILPVFSSRKSPAGESMRYAFKTLPSPPVRVCGDSLRFART